MEFYGDDAVIVETRTLSIRFLLNKADLPLGNEQSTHKQARAIFRLVHLPGLRRCTPVTIRDGWRKATNDFRSSP